MIIENKKLDFDECFRVLHGFKNHNTHWCKQVAPCYNIKSNRLHSFFNTKFDSGKAQKIVGNFSFDNNFIHIVLEKTHNGVELVIVNYEKILFDDANKMLKLFIPRLPTILKQKFNQIEKIRFERKNGEKYGLRTDHYKKNTFYLSNLPNINNTQSKDAYNNAVRGKLISEAFSQAAQNRGFKGYLRIGN